MTRAFELNPDLNARDYAGAYARDGVVRISNILKPDSAEAIARVLEAQTPWRLTISDEDNPKPGLYDAARIQSMGREALGAQIAAAMARARHGFAYLYLSYPMIRAYIEGWDPGHPIHAIAELINSQDFLDVFRQVTRRQDILKADAQATSYRPGDFLTLHDDDRGGGGSEGRIAAYTFGFTRIWRPDWGGQLLFHARTARSSAA